MTDWDRDSMIMNGLSYAPTHHELEFVFKMSEPRIVRGIMDYPKMKHNLAQIRGSPST